MASTAGFVWYELMTSDLAAAEAFYGKVIGWTLVDSGMPGMRYVLAKAGGDDVAGLMALPPDAAAAGAQPGWIGYVGVASADASAGAAATAGGTILKAPEDIPGIGRFAVVADPNGIAFALFEPLDGGESKAFALGNPGHAGWNELQSTDWVKSWPFYSGLFGWAKADAMPMQAGEVYQLFSAGGDMGIGAMFNAIEAPRHAWLFYWNVEDIDAATARVTAGGGTVLMGPVEVPGGISIIQARDPQGVSFALVGPRKA